MIEAVIESWPQPAHRRRDLALVVAVREAELVLRQQAGMLEFRLGDVGHDTTLRSGVTLSWS